LPLVMLTPEAVTSIVVNLVENARKYAPVDLTKPGAEPIRVQTRRGRDHVVLEVCDRGPGVAPEEAPRIFEAFYRVGNEATRTSRGTGLGLHLVALQAKAIGGAAGVLPRPGGGAIFWVRFPIARGVDLADAEPSPPDSAPLPARPERVARDVRA
jgi:two-component system OmpR family sensor kinase